MAYTAFGPDGPRVAFAISDDAYRWERLGLAHFEGTGTPIGDDKDAAFFPEPVMSPGGVRSLAFYHRPMLHLSALDGRAAIPMIERLPYEERESIRIAYVPLRRGPERSKEAPRRCRERRGALARRRTGARSRSAPGTPPVRIAEGWMSLFHGVDCIGNHGRKPLLTYSSGIVVHDLERPDRIVYRSRKPIISPETEDEREGTVDNVVFPTGMDPRPDLGERVFDFYYGTGDWADRCRAHVARRHAHQRSPFDCFYVEKTRVRGFGGAFEQLGGPSNRLLERTCRAARSTRRRRSVPSTPRRHRRRSCRRTRSCGRRVSRPGVRRRRPFFRAAFADRSSLRRSSRATR